MGESKRLTLLVKEAEGQSPLPNPFCTQARMEHVVMPLGCPREGQERINFLTHLRNPGTREGKPQQSLFVILCVSMLPIAQLP